MDTNRALSSPHRIVCELFHALRRLCSHVEDAHATKDEAALRQYAALSVILAVQCVEVFFNVYFRNLISEPAYAHAAKEVSEDLARTQCGLDKKIKNWPKLLFGRGLPLDKGSGQQFIELKNLRHKLMHFTSSHETTAIPGISIHGLADTTAYESLSVGAAFEALHTAEAFLGDVFTLRGIPPNDVQQALHSWTGRLPT